MPIGLCEGSIGRFDSGTHSVCPVLSTNARRIVTVYYRVLISHAPARVGKGHSSYFEWSRLCGPTGQEAGAG